MQPDFLGLGVHKGGSSWIHLALYEHPALCLPVRDLHFFSVDRVWAKDRPWYEQQFRPCAPSLRKGELSNTYFPSPSAPQRIHTLYPDVKLFVCLRNPVERAFSHYLQDLKMGHIASETTFADALDQHPEYIAWGRYRHHLERYRRLFAADRLLVLLFDDLVADPAAFIRTLYRFLEVNADFTPSVLHRRINASRIPRRPAIDRLSRRTARWMRQTRVGEWVWWQAKKSGLSERLLRWNATITPPPSLSLPMRTHLQALFTDDIAYVKGDLNRPDLDW